MFPEYAVETSHPTNEIAAAPTAKSNRFGQFHAADPTEPGYCQQLLVVFVHGILGNPDSTWTQLPNWIQVRADLVADSFSFAYGAGVAHSSSIEDAARDLAEWIRIEATNYRHFVFITHSTGGLVVKELLRRDFGATLAEVEKGQTEEDVWEFDTIGSCALRTRFVIHIAVPHRGGGAIITSAGLVLYHALFLCFFWLLYLCRFLSFGHLKWGYQSIFWQLRPGNPELRRMEEDFAAFERHFDETGLPRPLVFDIAADSDLAVAQTVLSASEGDAAQRSQNGPVALVERWQTSQIQKRRNLFRLRGTHFSVKIPKKPEEPVVTLLADILHRFKAPGLWAVAHSTIARVVNQARALGIRSLIKAAPEDGAESSIVEPLSELSGIAQATAFQEILAFVRHPAARAEYLVLSGPAGVGKSSVIRDVARYLARDFMLHDQALPIVFPLQDVRLEPSQIDKIFAAPGQRPEQLFSALLGDWCTWANKIIHPLTVRPEQILERLVRSRIVLIFDSVDEFLLYNPQFELLHFRQLRDYLTAAHGINSQLRVIFGIRETQFGYRELATSNHLVAVAPLTEAQIGRLGYAGLLERLRNSEARELLRIPLYLRALGEVERQLNRAGGVSEKQRWVAQLTTERVMQLLIETLIRTSGLTDQVEKRDGEQHPIETEEWLNALTIAGWLFFRTFRRGGRVSETALRHEAAELHKQWLEPELCQASKDLPGAEIELETFSGAFRLLADDTQFAALRDRTIFLRSGILGNEELRIWHREVMEFLVGRYFSKCIVTGNVDQLAKRGFTSKTARIAGELMHDYTFDAPLIVRALERAEKARAALRINDATFIVGNFAGLIANIRSPITGPALSVLFENLDKFPPVALHVLLDGCGYRALRNQPQDSAAPEIRASLIPVLFECVSGARKVNAVTRSAAWCYLAAFARTPGLKSQIASIGDTLPSYPQTRLRVDASQMDDALWLVWMVRDQPALDPRDRSVQIAFAELQRLVLTLPSRAISNTHYLYMLATAYRRKKYSEEVLQALRLIFAESSPYEEAIRDFTLVPELNAIFDACRNIYDGRVPAGMEREEND